MNSPRPLESLRRICVVMMFVFLHGCAPLPTGPSSPIAPSGPLGPGPSEPGQPSNQWLGRIAAIDGPNAFFDRGGSGTVFRAAVGQLLFAHDRFFTGPGSHMLIQFSSGGQAELDENTDPTLIQELNCLVISLFRSGQMFVDKSNACVETLQVASNQHSMAVYAVLPGSPPGVRITVIEGQAELVRPSPVLIPQGWRVEANGRGVMGTGRAFPLPPDELQRSIQWLRFVRFGPSPYAPAPPPPPVVTPQPYPTLPFIPRFGNGPRPPGSNDSGGSTGGGGYTGRTPSGIPAPKPSPASPSGVGPASEPGTSGVIR